MARNRVPDLLERGGQTSMIGITMSASDATNAIAAVAGQNIKVFSLALSGENTNGSIAADVIARAATTTSNEFRIRLRGDSADRAFFDFGNHPWIIPAGEALELTTTFDITEEGPLAAFSVVYRQE